jgi:hypothetical protein
VAATPLPHSNRTRSNQNFAGLPLALDVNMNRFTSITGKEEEPAGAPLQNRRTHKCDCVCFESARQASFDLANVSALAAAPS